MIKPIFWSAIEFQMDQRSRPPQKQPLSSPKSLPSGGINRIHFPGERARFSRLFSHSSKTISSIYSFFFKPNPYLRTTKISDIQWRPFLKVRITISVNLSIDFDLKKHKIPPKRGHQNLTEITKMRSTILLKFQVNSLSPIKLHSWQAGPSWISLFNSPYSAAHLCSHRGISSKRHGNVIKCGSGRCPSG